MGSESESEGSGESGEGKHRATYMTDPLYDKSEASKRCDGRVTSSWRAAGTVP
jgi:hypothetical protein